MAANLGQLENTMNAG